MKRINSFYPEKQIERLEIVAQHTGITMAEHLRRALEAYLASVKRRGIVPPELLEDKEFVSDR